MISEADFIGCINRFNFLFGANVNQIKLTNKLF